MLYDNAFSNSSSVIDSDSLAMSSMYFNDYESSSVSFGSSYKEIIEYSLLSKNSYYFFW